MKVRWTSAAARDRLTIWEHIAAENPMAAVRMDELFDAAATRLADFPNLGKLGLVPGTREILPHESYRLVYEVGADTVWILTLVHTARRWPPARSG